MQQLHNGPFANGINDKMLQPLFDRRINYAETVASLGHTNHKDKCIAKGKTRNNCGLQNHFSRACRKPKSSSTKPTRPNVNSIEENTIKQSVNAIQNTNYKPQCGSDYDSSDDNIIASIASFTVQIEPKNTILQIGNAQVGLLIDSGSVCSILNKSFACEVIINPTLNRWLTTAPAQELKTFANDPSLE